jgi:hypothetical protein
VSALNEGQVASGGLMGRSRSAARLTALLGRTVQREATAAALRLMGRSRFDAGTPTAEMLSRIMEATVRSATPIGGTDGTPPLP